MCWNAGVGIGKRQPSKNPGLTDEQALAPVAVERSGPEARQVLARSVYVPCEVLYCTWPGTVQATVCTYNTLGHPF